jgi:hypothetical protein
VSTTGPGVRWLAERSGCTPHELLADPQRLLTALADAGGSVTDLAARLRSDDDAVRAGAATEADRLRARLAAAPDPADQFRDRVAQTLRDAATRVREAPVRGKQT